MSKIAGALVVVLVACGETQDSVPASTQSADVATAWFALQLQLVRDTGGFTPPVASRAFAYSSIALYEAVVPGMPDHRSLAGALHELDAPPQPAPGETYYWPAAANAALAAITRDMFAPMTMDLAAIDALESQLDSEHAQTVSRPLLDRSEAYGRTVADAIYAWSRSDGGDEGYLHNFPASYVPPTGPGMWVPTPPAYKPAMQPYWGANRTFALPTAESCDPAPPLAYSTQPDSPFYIQAREVYETSLHLTDEQTRIAQFWADDPVVTATPPGHSISILTQMLVQNGATLDVAADAYAHLGIAVGDSFIACWAMKYRYNVVRPVTEIRAQFDPEWLPLIATPPFPEYPSGHSVQCAAGAQVMTDIFGTVAFTDHTNDARGLPSRSFESMSAAADEAAISRLYAGIHYRAAIEQGLAMGHCIGATTSALPFQR